MERIEKVETCPALFKTFAFLYYVEFYHWKKIYEKKTNQNDSFYI